MRNRRFKAVFGDSGGRRGRGAYRLVWGVYRVVRFFGDIPKSCPSDSLFRIFRRCCPRRTIPAPHRTYINGILFPTSVSMKKPHISSILLLILLFQCFSGGGSLFACLHRDHHTVHLSHVHAACPLSSEREAHDHSDREKTRTGRDEAGCVDIMLELLGTRSHPGISLGDTFRKILSCVSSGRIPPALSGRHSCLSRRRTTLPRHATTQCRIGTVMLTC